MALDVRGSLKNTKINKNVYVTVDELVSNAIDSYLLRKSEEPNVAGLDVSIDVQFFNLGLDLETNQYDMRLRCSDNGAGLRLDQTKAFVTKDTSYKDDLSILGIGQCKGSGRIQFLHYFKNLSIESSYRIGSGFEIKKLSFTEAMKEIDEKMFTKEENIEGATKTVITLDQLKDEILKTHLSDIDLRRAFSAQTLKYHVLVTFLQRFVSLQESLGDFKITFRSLHNEASETTDLKPSDLPDVHDSVDVSVFSRSPVGEVDEGGFESLTITHYKLDSSRYLLPSNAVALCAKSSPVRDITKRYLRTKTLENNAIQNFYHIILIEGSLLDKNVNEQRDDFDLPKDSEKQDSFLLNKISLEDIYNAVDEKINEMLVPPDWNKEEIIARASSKFGISAGMIAETNVRIHYGDTENSIVKRVLATYQDKILKDTSEIFEIREEITKTEPDSKDFREKVNELAWKYTSSLKSIDMANLSQLVVRRAAIVEILDLAIDKRLKIQQLGSEVRRKDERIIHSIFFPMGTNNHETSDHDIWLLSEEYHYYDYISSDQMLSRIKWTDEEFLFEGDVDEELEKLFYKNYSENSAKRPDIALFNKEGSVIIVEFKAPDVDLADHQNDLMEYSQLLAAKSKGRLKKFYGYLIGDKVNPNKLRGYTRFPSGSGWFGTEAIIEHTTGRSLGEIYSELLNYESIVEKAGKRLEVYKQRLNVDLR